MFAIRIELDDRKQQILAAIVRDYLQTVEPVGSRNIARNYLEEYSPATIRNEMSDLEDAGLIIQPHTSAGRIPTDLGYRYFVDHIMKDRPLSEKEVEFIDDQLAAVYQNAEDLIHRSLKVLSKLSHHTAIMSNLGEHERFYSSGLSNILRLPEFNSIERLKRILHALETEEQICKVITEYATDQGITIRIGCENKMKDIQDCSLVVASYSIKGKASGGLGIIGPTRMPYNRITQIVKSVARKLKNLF